MLMPLADVLMPLMLSIFRRSIKASGVTSPSFIIGTSECPPAMSFAPAPYRESSRDASCTVSGAAYEKGSVVAVFMRQFPRFAAADLAAVRSALASWIARHTLSEVSGMFRCLTPR